MAIGQENPAPGLAMLPMNSRRRPEREIAPMTSQLRTLSHEPGFGIKHPQARRAPSGCVCGGSTPCSAQADKKSFRRAASLVCLSQGAQGQFVDTDYFRLA